ncbi:GNAT family N-acetyltransferase [candidate division WOR-3 bacterium]|nr:GNAT family N-acetyltransferase [candidate division WOR-3 bacterium]
MNVTIRHANEADVEAIVRLYAEATKLMYELSPEGFGKRLGEPLDLDEEKENFSKAVDDEKSVILVAEVDGKVEGFVMGVIEEFADDLLDSPYMTVQYICVDEKQRKRGIGKALMVELEKCTTERGITNLDLIVWNGNKPAQSLFGKTGYIPLEIRMGKKLKG